VFPDQFAYVRGVGSRRAIERAIYDLRPGVTEINVRPAVDTPELRALTPDWSARVDEHDFVVNDHSVRSLLQRAGAHLVGYRELRELQRGAA
jgi:hypothetical protein